MKQIIASRISEALSPYARHDSRFGRDFSQFIPGFVGGDKAAQRLASEPEYAKVETVFVTPDNALQPFRLRALRDGKSMVMPSYGLQRGFLLLERAAVPAGQEVFASCLDGVDEFGRELSLQELRHRGPFSLLVAGASAITMQGLRFGMGSHYLDAEWGLLAQLGLVQSQATVAAIVHDLQLCEQELEALPSEVRADLILTPTRTVRLESVTRPLALDWGSVDPVLRNSPPLRELQTWPGQVL